MKKFRLIILMITISSIVGMVIILLSPPLIDGAVYFTPDKNTVLVAIGNKGFASLHIDISFYKWWSGTSIDRCTGGQCAKRFFHST